MALDAGTHLFVIPDPTATSATPALANDITLASGAVVGGFFVAEDMDLAEAGVTFTTAGTTTPLVFTLSRCADTLLANAVVIPGLPVVNPTTGAVTAASGFATASTATVPIGTTIKKKYDFRLNKGDFVVITITTATTAATGYFYVKCYPAGEANLPTKLQSTTVVSTLESTT